MNPNNVSARDLFRSVQTNSCTVRVGGLMCTALKQSLLLVIWTLIVRSSSYQVIQEVGGSVGAGEYSLYRVELTSTLALVLITDQGDGDLYVSLTDEPPTFELYDYASQTCGADIVILPNMDDAPKNAARAGVYGHIRYNTTEYRLYLIKYEIDLEFFDTLKIANDPLLLKIVKDLQSSGQASNKSPSFWSSLGEWIIWILLNGLEFGIEVFL